MSLDDVKKRILARVPLVSLIGEQVKLTARGDHHSGLCPFHNESGPSFAVYHDHYFCYGCKAHGDAITYARQQNGFSFIEALRYLAGKYSIEAHELEESRGRFGRAREEASLYSMLAEAQLFFESNLNHLTAATTSEPAREAFAYLKGRGFSEENIKAFGFGLTPREGYGLVKHLRSKGYKDADMLACSLATTSTRDQRTFDFFRHRITLPIRDPMGRVIGFGGRTTDNNPAKYINSRDTKLFDKSHTLFGFDRARRRMRERTRAIVVEGYMDALMLWQAGLDESVACLGTAFTEHHLKLLHHATGTVVLLFDGDSAGQKATLASVAVALTQPDMQIKAVQLPSGDDPDDFIRKHGVDALQELIQKSTDLLDFAIGQHLKHAHTLAVPELVTKDFIPWLAKIPDRLQRSFLTVKISQLTGIPVAHLDAQLADTTAAQAAMTRRGARGNAAQAVRQLVAEAQHKRDAASASKPLDALGFDLFGHVFYADPADVDTAVVKHCANTSLDLDDGHSLLMEDMLTALEKGVIPAVTDRGAWLSTHAPEIAALVERLLAAEKAFSCNDRQSRLRRLLAAIQARQIKGKISSLKTQVARLAATPGNDNEVRRILTTIVELTRSLNEPL